MPRIADAVLAEIRARLQLAEVVGRHTRLRRSGRTQCGRCPLHQGRSENFHVYPDGHFYCFGCQQHGDVIRFVMLAESCDFPTAAARCAQDAGVALAGDAGGPRPAPRPMPDPGVEAEKDALDAARRRERARTWWTQAAEIAPGDPVALYLASRHLWPLTVAERAVLRLAHLEHPNTGAALHPVMLARVDDARGQGCAVWRTYLAPVAGGGFGKLGGTADGAKLGYAPMPPGSAVRLVPIAPVLGVGEGIETTLSANRLTGTPCWSVLSTTGMKRFIAPDGVARLTVFADRDPARKDQPEGPGIDAALKLAASAGVPVEIRRPLPPAGDYADVWLMRRGVAA